MIELSESQDSSLLLSMRFMKLKTGLYLYLYQLSLSQIFAIWGKGLLLVGE